MTVNTNGPGSPDPPDPDVYRWRTPAGDMSGPLPPGVHSGPGPYEPDPHDRSPAGPTEEQREAAAAILLNGPLAGPGPYRHTGGHIHSSAMPYPYANALTPGVQVNVTAPRPGVNHALHLVLTLLTCGMWAPVWIALAVAEAVRR